MKKNVSFIAFTLFFINLKAETQAPPDFIGMCHQYKQTTKTGADTTLEAYVGVYKLDENVLSETYTITLDNGKLYGQAVGYDRTELTKQADAHAFKSGYGSDVIFIQEEADKPFKIKLVVQGNTVMGVKQ